MTAISAAGLGVAVRPLRVRIVAVSEYDEEFMLRSVQVEVATVGPTGITVMDVIDGVGQLVDEVLVPSAVGHVVVPEIGGWASAWGHGCRRGFDDHSVVAARKG